MSSADHATRTVQHLVQVLGRIEAAVQHPTHCCTNCGCLCRRGETCPNCAIANIRRAS